MTRVLLTWLTVVWKFWVRYSQKNKNKSSRSNKSQKMKKEFNIKKLSFCVDMKIPETAATFFCSVYFAASSLLLPYSPYPCTLFIYLANKFQAQLRNTFNLKTPH